MSTAVTVAPRRLNSWATRVVPVKRSSAVQASLEVSMSPRTDTSRRFEPMYLMGTLRPSVESETATEVKHGGGLLSEPTTREDGHRRDPHRPPPGTTPAVRSVGSFAAPAPSSLPRWWAPRDSNLGP